jgi:predicted nucleic acid-binding protein
LDVTPDRIWLIDKSALGRLGGSIDADAWLERVRRGLVRITAPTALEVGYSARSGPDWHRLVEEAPLALIPMESLTPQIERRALTVQGMLADRGEHRAPSVPDLLVAAADVTGQPVERIRVH